MQFAVVNDFAGDDVRAFLQYLIGSLGNGIDVPISEIFDRIPFGPMGGTTRDDLLARGTIRAGGAATDEEYGLLTNRGDEVFGEFTDDILGDIAIVFPDYIEAQYRVSPEAISVAFPDPVEVSLYILPTLPGDLRRDVSQRLTAINATRHQWTYYLHTDGNPAESLALIVDFPDVHSSVPAVLPTGKPSVTKSEHISRAVRMVSKGRSHAVCPCCDGPKRINLRTHPRAPINLHVRRLVEPTAFTVDEYVQAIRDVLTNSGVTGIPVNVVTNTAVHRPDLEDLDVNEGDSGESTEQSTLFANTGIPAGEFACYIIRSFVFVDPDSDIVGRGRLPGFALAVEHDAPRYTWAHELGHNLGMNHDETTNCVMNKTVVPDDSHPIYTQQQVNDFLRR